MLDMPPTFERIASSIRAGIAESRNTVFVALAIALVVIVTIVVLGRVNDSENGTKPQDRIQRSYP
jgi:hypothetical protein